MSDAPEASILIVGYRSKPYIERCIEGAVRASRGSRVEILFIDCSGDGSEQLLLERFPQVRIVPHRGNLGFARGNNALAAEARGAKLLLLNPDAFAERDEIDALLRFSREHPDAGAWTAVTVLPGGTVDPGCMQPMLGFLSSFLILVGLGRWRPGALDPNAGSPQRVPVATGAFLLVRSDLWRSLGGFDERFFMYAEEVDLCRRIADAGASILAEPRIRILHDTGSGARRSGQRLVQLCRGNATFFDKHQGPCVAWASKSVLLLNAWTRRLYGKLRGKQDYVDGYGAVVARRAEWWSGWPKPEPAEGR